MSGHTCNQIFIDVEGFFWIISLFRKAEVGMALRAFARQVGIPNELHFDRAAEQMGPQSDLKCAISESSIKWIIQNLSHPGRTAVRI